MSEKKDYSFFLSGSHEKGILLVHGLTGSPSEMKFVGKYLNKIGFTVYAPVISGHCTDKESLIKTRYEDWVESLRIAIYHLKKYVKEIHVAGICVGGALGLLLAAEEDNINSVTIYSPALRYDGWSTPFYYPLFYHSISIIGRFPLINHIGFKEKYPFGFKSDRVRQIIMSHEGSIAGALTEFPLKALYENYRLVSAMKEVLPNIKTPTLLIHAREDDLSHPDNAYKIQKLHGGPCHVELLENSYHMIHMDQERQKVASMTADFVGIPNTRLETGHTAASIG